jgi:hypothetical protein
MELVLKGKLENVFKAKDYKDKISGDVTPGKYQAQFIEQVESDEGSQLVIHKVSVPEEKVQLLKNKIGEIVSLPVKAYSNKGQVGFYGV